MLAVVFSKPEVYSIGQVAQPEVRPGEVLVKVKSTTICGTDLKIFHGTVPHVAYPHIPGHEFSGEIAALGDGVFDLAVGDKVGVEVHAGCGRCPRCAEGLYNLCLNYGAADKGHAHIGFTVPGGLAEYCAVPARVANRLPEGLSFDQGAFTDSLGIVLWAFQRAGGVNPGDRVVIIGPGALGLLAVQAARAFGAAGVIAVGTPQDANRLQAAAELGADFILQSDASDQSIETLRDLCGGQGADLVIEFAGTSNAAQLALKIARRGGRVVLAGATSPGQDLQIDLATIVRGHLDVYGSVANPKNISHRANSLIERGDIKIEPLISHHMPLSEFDRAWEIFTGRAEDSIRIMMHPEGV